MGVHSHQLYIIKKSDCTLLLFLYIRRSLQEGQDIFGVDFDYDEFEKYEEDEYEEEDEEDDYIEDDDDGKLLFSSAFSWYL